MAADWMPFGGYFFTQSLARSMDIEPATAKAFKHALADGDLPPQKASELETHLAVLRRRWHLAVLGVLTELSPADSLPRRIFITGGGSLLPGLDKLLRTDPVPFDAAPEVSLLGRQALPVKDLTGALSNNLFTLTLSLTAGLPE